MIARGAVRALAVLVATVTIVSGCVDGSGSVAPSASSSAVAAATSSPPATPAATATATPVPQTPRPSPSPSPSPMDAGSPSASPDPYPHADADLERYLPTQAGSVELLAWSQAGSEIPPAGGDMCLLLCGNEPREFADALGIPLDRVTVAFAVSEQLGIGGIAFRAKGIATDRLADAGAAISGGVVGGGQPLPMTVAGREVTFLYRMNRGQYLIPIDDVLVFLYGEPPMTAEGGISPTGTVHPDLAALIDTLPR